MKLLFVVAGAACRNSQLIKAQRVSVFRVLSPRGDIYIIAALIKVQGILCHSEVERLKESEVREDQDEAVSSEKMGMLHL